MKLLNSVFRSNALFFMFLLLLSSSVTIFGTTDEALEDRVREISHQLRCPTCQAQSVKESEAGLSVNMKNKIREMLKEGRSEKEIISYFVDRYGEWILRSPKKEGFNLVLWVTPLVLVCAVGAIVILVLLKKSRGQQVTQQHPLTSKEQSLLDKDLNKFQEE